MDNFAVFYTKTKHGWSWVVKNGLLVIQSGNEPDVVAAALAANAWLVRFLSYAD